MQRSFARLCLDLERNGLTLGHGGNKGFGWFTVSVKEWEG